MDSIVFAKTATNNYYNSNTFLRLLKDKFCIDYRGETYIKELGLSITTILLPPNINKEAYLKNMKRAASFVRNKDKFLNLAPKVFRKLDFTLFSNFQRRLLAYSVFKSVQLMLRIKNKSIKDSCIVIYDAADYINYHIICTLAEKAKYIILLSDNIKEAVRIQEYIIANFGITPVITQDKNFAFKCADFAVLSRDEEINTAAPLWYLNDAFIPKYDKGIFINDVTFSVPWDMGNMVITPEILGAILSQMEEKDIEKSLTYNGISLDEIRFNNYILE